MAEKVQMICEDSELRREIIANGIEFTRKLNDKERAASICNVIEDAILFAKQARSKIAPDMIF
jgi:hypothetical protein